MTKVENYAILWTEFTGDRKMIQAKSFRIDLSSCEDPSERIEKEVDRLSKEESEIEITHVVQTACGPYNQNLVTTIFYKIK